MRTCRFIGKFEHGKQGTVWGHVEFIFFNHLIKEQNAIPVYAQLKKRTYHIYLKKN